jgi:beta-glucosidase
MKYTLDWNEYAKLSRQMAAEGCVLLQNENNTLPIKKNEKVAIFGRVQTDYIKSGTGSGGMVNTPYVISILDALKEEEIEINPKVLSVYEEWIKDNPYDKGEGWATEPWCQLEMKLPDNLAKEAAKESDIALVILGRTAGEDKDNSATKGSYYISDEEEELLKDVTDAFKRVAVILNTGNIIDMSFMDKYHPSAAMYVWQGGAEGGHAAADVLMGRVNPCGRLSDTIAYSIEDYPSTKNFGNKEKNYYEEDIYIGYKYFETCAKDKVRYPFGYGLSYTEFSCEYTMGITEFDEIRVDCLVENTGKCAGKEVIQVYANPPQGKLYKPLRNLVAFGKTEELEPGEKQQLTINFDISSMASFDDSGVTGNKDCFVLEAGDYLIYAGENVREAKEIGSFNIGKTVVTSKESEACTPVEDLERIIIKPGDTPVIEKEKAPKRSYDLAERIKQSRPKDRPCTGRKGYTFADLMSGKVDADSYLDQLSDEDLICISRGEGMSSPKVTPGIAGSFGGVTKRLKEEFGMPIAGCSDGPSGIRMDCGAEAFALPNGTLQACTFNLPLIEKLYEYEGMELCKNKIDVLLGPGINIHRNPLNGRNFEYYSEDPYLTGACAVAELRGLHKYNVTGACKHFSTNNQEACRHSIDAVVSARALREIYLKPFEMAVKKAGAYCIMTTYGPLNNIWTAGNYDLNTKILREDWGFKGLVMTDWWAKMNEDGSRDAKLSYTTVMVRAQNDVYMVTSDSESNANDDDTAQGLKEGRITRGELLRNAKNICYALSKTLAGRRCAGEEDEVEEVNRPTGNGRIINIMPYVEIGHNADLDLTGLDTSAGVENMYTIRMPQIGFYEMTVRLRSKLGELSQTSITVMQNSITMGIITISGTGDEWVEKKVRIESIAQLDNYISLYFAQSGAEIDNINIKFEKALEKKALAK